MFIEQLDCNKIRVIVDIAEQKEYGVTYESMTYSDSNTRRLCECIMEKAKKEIGFNVGGAKLLVEAKRQNDGTVTLFLSKINENNDKSELFGQTVVFKTFDSLYDCREAFVGFEQMINDISLYCMNERYYLYFEMIGNRYNASQLLRCLLEFGEKTHITPQILAEHGEKITLISFNYIMNV